MVSSLYFFGFVLRGSGACRVVFTFLKNNFVIIVSDFSSNNNNNDNNNNNNNINNT